VLGRDGGKQPLMAVATVALLAEVGELTVDEHNWTCLLGRHGHRDAEGARRHGRPGMEADVDGDCDAVGVPARGAAVGHGERPGRVTHYAHKRAALYNEGNMNMNQKLSFIAGTVAAAWLISAQAAPPACDPRLLGTWEVDYPERTVSDTPVSMTLTWKDIGHGKVTLQMTAVQIDGQVGQQLITVGPRGADGTSPISGDPGSDSETVVSPDPRTLVESTFKKGRQVTKTTYRFSLDGRQVSIDIETSDPRVRVVMNLHKK
jgi:hypothetical protein